MKHETANKRNSQNANMKYTIITITKNNPVGLKKTKQSIESQKFSDFEWVVIDGEKEPDNGIYDAMNKGIDRAKGEYVIFMNAGDQFVNAQVLEDIADYDADFIYGDSLGKRSKHHNRIPYGMITHHQAMVYRRAVMGDLRYDEHHPIAADYKFTLDYIQKCRSFLRLDMPICIFESGGFSEQNTKQGRMEQIAIRKELGIRAPFTLYRQWVGQVVKGLLSSSRAKPRDL